MLARYLGVMVDGVLMEGPLAQTASAVFERLQNGEEDGARRYQVSCRNACFQGIPRKRGARDTMRIA